MLYVTTRVKQDAFTANRALSESRGPEGGFFLPMCLPKFDEKQIKELGEKSFSRNMADVINLFFNTELDSWALEFAIGRYPVKLVRLGSKTILAQTWHNPQWRFERLVVGVEKAIRQSDQISREPSDWLMIASRIAVLFGIFGELIANGEAAPGQCLDIAVPSGDFSAPMAVWYAREMGLPIGNIVVSCNENGGLWNLLNKGELRTGAVAVKTDTPRCDHAVPKDLERLIFSALGGKETARFCEVCRRGGTYYLEPEQLKQLRRGMFVSVVGRRRLSSTVANLMQNYGCLPDPYAALAHSGLHDYRATAGEGRTILVLSEESPAYSLEFLSSCLGISPGELKNRMEQT